MAKIPVTVVVRALAFHTFLGIFDINRIFLLGKGSNSTILLKHYCMDELMHSTLDVGMLVYAMNMIMILLLIINIQFDETLSNGSPN